MITFLVEPAYSLVKDNLSLCCPSRCWIKTLQRFLLPTKEMLLPAQIINALDGGILAHEETDRDILAAAHERHIAVRLMGHYGLDR